MNTTELLVEIRNEKTLGLLMWTRTWSVQQESFILWWRRDALQQEQRRGWACINKDRKAARDLLQMLKHFNNPEAEINKFSTWLQEHVMYIITSVLSTKYISRMSPNKANEVEKIISQKFAIFSLRPRITYKRFTSQIYQGKPENKREVVHMFLVCI